MHKIYFFVAFLTASFSKISAGTFSIDYKNHVFLKDGKSFRYISGDIHYFRIHPDLWNDRLQRVRALGLNMIQTYAPWNWHEPEEGTFDFSGFVNLTRFLTLAQQNQLSVLFRPGPYIDAEWEFGGYPYWLQKYDGIELRTHEPIYLNKVQNYFNRLLDVVKPFLYKNGGPILMVQVENEYGDHGCDHNYTKFLRDLIWNKLGNDVVLYTTDYQKPNQTNLQCGHVDGALSTTDFGLSGNDDVKRRLDNLYNFSGGGPLVVSEYWVYNFVTWGQQYRPGTNHWQVVKNLEYILSRNASVNIYMIHGGTNFGFMNGETTKVITTSYDYGAAIAENGDITETYMAIRGVIQNLTNWEQKPLAVPKNNTAHNYGKVTLKRIGSSLLSALTQIEEPCVGPTTIPLSFAKLEHGYGFVLYTTTLTQGGKVLEVPQHGYVYGINDFGYVYLNNNYQGMLIRSNTTSLIINASPGDTLRILVENAGRNDGGYRELKGLFNVTLDGKQAQNWYQCGINLKKSSVDSLSTIFYENPEKYVDKKEEKATSSAGVYAGTFETNIFEDTFLDTTGWGKGQIFINGYNLGRYWPRIGPQMTLYIPKPFIQPKNTILIIELLGAQQNYVNFVDHHIWNYPN